MSDAFVLDASVALCWFLDHPVPPYANRIRQLLISGSSAVVPTLWHLEMANGLVVAERRGVLSASDVDRSLFDLEQLLAQMIQSDAALISVLTGNIEEALSRPPFTAARLADDETKKPAAESVRRKAPSKRANGHRVS